MRIDFGHDPDGRVRWQSGASRAVGREAAERLRPLVVGALIVVLLVANTVVATADSDAARAEATPGPNATLAEIEACATRNLPNAAGVIGFRVEAIGRSGETTRSRAQIRWRRDADSLSRVVLRVSEPAKTAGTALLIIDRKSDQPEFFVRLPDLPKVKRVRSKRLRGPVLGTDFSYEDLDRLREPLDKTGLELIGVSEVDGRAAWLLETLPGRDGTPESEYSRVLTYIDQDHCLPLQVDLFEGEDRLRKRLRASMDSIRQVDSAALPEVFVMEDLRRETRTVVRVEHFETRPDLPAEQFTKRALAEPAPAAAARP